MFHLFSVSSALSSHTVHGAFPCLSSPVATERAILYFFPREQVGKKAALKQLPQQRTIKLHPVLARFPPPFSFKSDSRS